MFLNILLFFVFLLTIFYFWVIYIHGHWERKKIPGPKPKFFFGNLQVKKSNFGEYAGKIYNDYKSEPFVGIFMVLKKAFIVNDLDLIKNILVKDHHPYFEGHGFTLESNSDPITQHLFNLEGEAWKKMRVKLTPTFTSSKMKMMYETMHLCADEMVKYLEQYADKGQVVDYKEVIGKLGTDIIASCAYGLQSNSFKDENAEFREMGRRVVTGVNSIRRAFIMVLTLVSPKIADFIAPDKIPTEVSNFMFRIVKETVEYREKNNIRRNDFLQLLIDMKNNKEKPEDSLTLSEITAQVFVFFIAGFETSSTTGYFALLELCRNREVMDKVVKEIDEAVRASDGGRITYETLNKMTYLTEVVNETLRMYPPLSFLLRRCTADYQVPGSGAVIEKGTLIVIPSLGIHRDPDIYPDPLTFDPERFTQENIQRRHLCAHIPFGEGPRLCIGARFGAMQVKLALIETLRHYEVQLVDQLPKVLEFQPTITLQSKENYMLRLKKRTTAT